MMEQLTAGILCLAALISQAQPLPLETPAQPTEPDLWFQWQPSQNTNVAGYWLYYGKHYPAWTERHGTTSTNLYVTNCPLYQNDWWLTATNAAGQESVPTSFALITTTNGYEFSAYTFSTRGTGDVYTCSEMTPANWHILRTNTTGDFLITTNPVATGYFKLMAKAPLDPTKYGIKIRIRSWNQ